MTEKQEQAMRTLLDLAASGALTFRDPPCSFCGEPVAVGTAMRHCPEAREYHGRALRFFGLRPAED